MPAVRFREVASNAMIKLRSMSPCSFEGIEHEILVQTIGVTRDNVRGWTAEAFYFMTKNGMIEHYDDVWNSFVPTDHWYDVELDAGLDGLEWPTFIGAE